MADTIAELFPRCTWEVTGYLVPLPVKKITERGGNRIVRRPRQNRNGAKLEDTGSAEKQWILDVDFYNGCEEPGMPSDDMYPGLPYFLTKSFDVHETGTLTLPTIGKRRCRAESYERVDTFEEGDTAIFSLTFTEDNEDTLTASTFTAPSARAVSRRLAEVTTFSAEQAGVSLADFGSGIAELASEIESLVDSPFEYVGDLEAQANKVVYACKRIEAMHTAKRDDVGRMLANPPHAKVVAGLFALRDKAARIVDERQSALPRLVPYVVPSPQRSIFDIAAQLSQDAALLIKANPKIEDLLAIPAGTVVKVFDAAR